MLDTHTLHDRYEEMMDAWLEAYSELLLGGYSLCCDICHMRPEDGKLYNIPGEPGRELLICQVCYDSCNPSIWREP